MQIPGSYAAPLHQNSGEGSSRVGVDKPLGQGLVHSENPGHLVQNDEEPWLVWLTGWSLGL